MPSKPNLPGAQGCVSVGVVNGSGRYLSAALAQGSVPALAAPATAPGDGWGVVFASYVCTNLQEKNVALQE